MNSDYLSNIYKDFFGDENTLTLKEETEQILSHHPEEWNEKINQLLVDDDSKELLKKMISYMEQYKNGEKKHYLGFHVVLEMNNLEVRNSTISLLSEIASYFQYISHSSKQDVSFYHFDKIDDLRDIFSKSSIITFKDLKGLDLKDEAYKKVLFHILEENMMQHQLLFICGTKEEIGQFFMTDFSFQEKYFPFKICSKNPDVQDIYQEVLQITDSENALDDDFKIKILDYISETFPKTDLEYPIYREALCREISFYHRVPELEKEKSLDEIFEELNELVGLEKVKDTLHELVDFISLRDKDKDLKMNAINLHMVFLGNPGTGKTTVARILSSILYHLGYIKQNKLIEVTDKDLVAEYVGQTSPKTMAVIEKALGGILFIDEAYSLASKGNSNTYNDEAIATLIKAMEDYRDRLVVIFAGYTKEMQDFLDSNSGIVSRIGYTMEFDDYSEDQLVEIFLGFMKKSGFVVKDEAILRLREIIREYQGMKNFGNARFVRSVYEKTIIKHAKNTRDKKRKDILRTITKEDISVEGIKK